MADSLSTSKRKFTIKPYRMHQPMDRSDAGGTWDILSNAIDEIYRRNASQLSFEELYRAAYNLVLHKHGTLLYEGVAAKIQQHLLHTVTHDLQIINHTTTATTTTGTDTTTASTSSTNTSNLLFLEAVAYAWNEHCVTMTMIRDILMYMDRTYVQQQKRRPVYELGLHLFRITVWEHPTIRTAVISLVLEAIQRERYGQLLDDFGLTVKQIIGMLLELGRADYAVLVYQEDFEKIFLTKTQEFFHIESLQYLSSSTAAQYVRKAVSRIEQEKVRCIHLQLPQTTVLPLQTIVQTEWIERHAIQLVEMESTGFAALLQQAGTNTTIVGTTTSNNNTTTTSATTTTTEDATNNNIKKVSTPSLYTDDKVLQEMREMYELFVRVPASVDYLRDALSERIKSTGKQLIHDQMTGQADPAAFVRGVLHMRQQYEIVVQIAFMNEKKAQKRMKEAFEDFLNVDARAASCLAVYVDELLRTGLRGATEEQINIELQKVIIVFRYLSDKDVFESFYKQHLAKRLLGNRSVSDDAERSMVSLLKAECGYQFTTKLEGMFNDMRISRETRDKYKAYKRGQPLNNNNNNKNMIDIEVDVLTTGYWPSQNVPPCTLPIVVQDAIQQFSKFYLEKHTGRKLSWQTSAGAAELKATFGVGTTKVRYHELCVSTYQMCILLLFNTVDTLTLGQIRVQTHIPDMELRRHLISLCTPKNRILKKASKGRSIVSDSDTFTFNNDYTSKLKRVKIQLVKETSIVSTASTTMNAAGIGGPGTKQQRHGSGVDDDGNDTTNAQDAAAVGMATARGAGGVGNVMMMNNQANHNNNMMMNIDGSVPMAVEEDRRHLVEAAIVRIMKARKSLNHNDLIAEVTKQLSVRFNPSPIFIKKRIESLIDREYIERDEQEHRMYLYVA